MTLAAVLLAAGRSTRFGAEDKVAAPLGGLPLGHHAARTLRVVPFDRRYVVAAPGSLDWPEFAIIANDRPELGLARSLALGVAAARVDGATAVLIALADMPFVPADHYRAIIARHHGPASRIATGDGARRMPPALFGAAWFGALEALSGDRGAGALLAGAAVVTLAPDLLVDIDTQLDLDYARHRSPADLCGPIFAALRWRQSDRGSIVMRFVINDRNVEAEVDPRTSLLDLLREDLRLTGTKKGCNQGACGACTVLVDGERILSCLTLAVQVGDRAVTTVEGLGQGSALHPLQAAFVEHDGFQCGYCTPGQLCSAIGMAAELTRGVPSHVTADLSATAIAPTRAELAERMSGNLCRCGAHNGIIDAIDAVYGEADAADRYQPATPEKVA